MVGSDWVDLRDPNVIAENELLQAAASIEAAAKKLSELQPRREVVCPYMEWVVLRGRRAHFCGGVDIHLVASS